MKSVAQCSKVVHKDEQDLALAMSQDLAWRPYCIACTGKHQMIRESYGYSCLNCGHKVRQNMTTYHPPKRKDNAYRK